MESSNVFSVPPQNYRRRPNADQRTDYCGFTTTDGTALNMVRLVEMVATFVREETGREFSINMVYRAVCLKNGVELADPEPSNNIRQGLFCLFGHLTMLFTVPRDLSDTHLEILKPFNRLVFLRQKPIEDTALPVGGLLGGFGRFVSRPKKKRPDSISNWPAKRPKSVDLATSVINVYALTEVGKIKLK